MQVKGYVLKYKISHCKHCKKRSKMYVGVTGWYCMVCKKA